MLTRLENLKAAVLKEIQDVACFVIEGWSGCVMLLD